MDNKQTFRVGDYQVTVTIELTPEEKERRSYLYDRDKASDYLLLCRAGHMHPYAICLLDRVRSGMRNTHGKDGEFLKLLGITMEDVNEYVRQGEIQYGRSKLAAARTFALEGSTYMAGRDMYYVHEVLSKGITHEELGTTSEEISSLPSPISPHRGKP